MAAFADKTNSGGGTRPSEAKYLSGINALRTVGIVEEHTRGDACRTARRTNRITSPLVLKTTTG